MKFLQISDIPEAPELAVSKGFITDVPPEFYFFVVKNNLCDLVLLLIDRENPQMQTTGIPRVRASVMVTLGAMNLDIPEEKARWKAKIKPIWAELSINDTVYFSDNIKEIKNFRNELIKEIHAQRNK